MIPPKENPYVDVGRYYSVITALGYLRPSIGSAFVYGLPRPAEMPSYDGFESGLPLWITPSRFAGVIAERAGAVLSRTRERATGCVSR
jgi:hypothetical protein